MGVVIFVCAVAFFALLGTYVYFAVEVFKRKDEIARAEYLAEKIARIGTEAWSFFRPILQAALVLAITITVLTYFKVDLTAVTRSLQWDIRSLLAFSVVAAFCVAAIGGSTGSHLLKDVSLVIIGFYFGGLTTHT